MKNKVQFTDIQDKSKIFSKAIRLTKPEQELLRKDMEDSLNNMRKIRLGKKNTKESS